MRRLFALLAACLVTPACLSNEPIRAPRAPVISSSAPELDTRVRVDRETGVMVRQWQVLRHPDGRTEKHGFERGWYADGQPEFERAFTDGEPSGLWRSWHADGILRSEYEWSAGDVATPMRFWHPNGALSAEGLAVRGRREGRWTFWFENGVVSEAGEYRGNVRHGDWTIYRPDGSIRSRGRYANDARVGDWQHPPDPHAPDRPVVLEPPPDPPDQ